MRLESTHHSVQRDGGSKGCTATHESEREGRSKLLLLGGSNGWLWRSPAALCLCAQHVDALCGAFSVDENAVAFAYESKITDKNTIVTESKINVTLTAATVRK